MNHQEHPAEHVTERLKDLPHRLKEELEQVPYHLEQHPPNRPNFLLVVLLSGAAIIVVFIIAWFFLHWGGNDVIRHPYRRHPTSQLILPQRSAPSLATTSPFGTSRVG